MTTRRHLIGSLTAAVAAATAAPVFAQGAGIGEIRLDLSGLRAQGWAPPLLNIIDASLRRSLDRAFPQRGGGPTLIVKVNSINLSGSDGGGGGGAQTRGGNAGTTDYMDGELLLVARNGALVRREPLLNALGGEGGPAWWAQDNNARRLAALADGFGYWAGRKLG